MMLAPRELGRSLLVAGALLLACIPTPAEVEVDTNVTMGTVSGDTTMGPGPVTAADATASVGETMGEDTGPSIVICGDGIVELPEECDLGPLNGSGMYCTEDCTTNICGDGYVGPGEACDDGNQSNEDLCTTECGPTSCGDGVIQGAEQCDEGEGNSTSGACLPSCMMASCGDTFIHEGVESCDGNNTAGDDCPSQGFDGGELLCSNDCATFDTSSCYRCGDDAIDPGEDCDGAMLGGETCLDQRFDAGTLACSPSCNFDVSGCISFACGNGVIDGSDQCDGAQLGGATCMSQGFDGGTISCSAGCTFDTTNCFECGDGDVDPGEQCDTMNLGGNDCGDLGMPGMPSGGVPACNGTCDLIVGSCTFCGDGLRQGTEACDGAQIGASTCADFAGAGETPSGGMPACNGSCMLFEGTCTFCGDGVRQGTEQCDGAQLGGGTCASVLGAGHGGTLGCNGTCTYNTTMCCLNGGQMCNGMDELCCDGSCNASGGTQC